MKHQIAGVLIAALAALNSGAKADDIPPCKLPKGVTLVPLLSDAPSALQAAVAKDVGELAPPSENFDATDVVVTGKPRRLIFIWRFGQRWIVATELGGITYSNPIFAYDLDPGRHSAAPVGTRSAIPATVCTTAESLLRAKS
jgi:hypothetical protein